MSDDQSKAMEEVVNPEPVKISTFEEYFKLVLSKHGLTLEDLVDYEDPSKRPLYKKQAKGLPSLASFPPYAPMPNSFEEAGAMTAIADERFNTTKLDGKLDVRKIVTSIQLQREAKQRELQNRKLIESFPSYVVWFAKFLVFVKNLFRRTK
jgi:hypothetical protein